MVPLVHRGVLTFLLAAALASLAFTAIMTSTLAQIRVIFSSAPGAELCRILPFDCSIPDWVDPGGDPQFRANAWSRPRGWW
jgi:hypothetical protein